MNSCCYCVLLFSSLYHIFVTDFQASFTAESENVWKRLPLSAESLGSSGIYIYDDGFRFVLWFGRMLSPDIARSVLGEDYATDYSKVCIVSYHFFFSCSFVTYFSLIFFSFMS